LSAPDRLHVTLQRHAHCSRNRDWGQEFRVHWKWFEELDAVRRMQGRMLDASGFRPVETPYRIVHSEPGVALRRYDNDGGSGPPVLIVPAPIKRPYIWDMAPEISVVRRCLAAGMRVFLADWTPAPHDFGLADYAERLILACLSGAGGEPTFLLGHSLGGCLAAIFSALHAQPVRGLVLLASPLSFGSDATVFRRMVAELDDDEIPESLPGSFLGMASFNAAPTVFGWERWLDGALSLADSADVRRHMQVERWTLDEFALPRRFIADLVRLVRENRFANGALELGSRRAGPAGVTSPLLAVIDPHCAVVPPPTVLPFFEATGTRDRIVMYYERDTGVALHHVGPLVSRRAHESLWPQIIRWMQAR
jgi:polyhydroxyalkanoate synthase